LVNDNIEAGRNVVEALDAAGFPVEVAFWLYNSEQDRWKLWIGSSHARGDRGQAYLDVLKILNAVKEKKVLDLPRSDSRRQSIARSRP
jgi:hypothetical protein